MIDIENEVFSNLTDALKAFDSNVNTSSVYTNSPSSYPFVSIEEIDNSVNDEYSDCCEIENCANIGFEINIYTKGNTKKSEAKKLLVVADNYMKNIGFIRISKNSMEDQNETLYRYIVRYEAVVDKNYNVYRR